MKALARTLLAALFAVLPTALLAQSQAENKPAEPDVVAANRAVLSQLPFGDHQDFDDAMRGFIAGIPDSAHPDQFAFLKQDAPPTVNPSLWREAQLDSISGLFKVVDGVYQVRNLGGTSMTIVEGKTGVILIDTLSSPSDAKLALDLYFAHRPPKPVVAVIYSHNHSDHYSGAGAVVSPADAASGKVKVVAPIGFMDALIEEASVAANLAGRRAQFQFGFGLPVGDRGMVEYGEGEIVPQGPVRSGPIIPPNDTIRRPIETRTIDGVPFVFQLALNTEAPSEMFIYLPKAHVLDVGEDATHTLHNLLPIRGTLVRDALSWSHALNNALDHFGGDAQVLIDQHQWPVWGNDRVRTKLENHRDLYQYIHDQTLRMMNEGMGPNEIAAAITMPPGLEKDWASLGYYGNLSQDAKAVYQKYIGWYDGNPADLDSLPRVEEATKTIEYMGGADRVMARAREDFRKGNYRWVAEVMDEVVFTEPSNQQARNLAADAFEQMGYLAQSAPWRNSYLKAAQELRSGMPGSKQSVPGVAPNVLAAMQIGEVFDYLGTRIDGPRAGTAHIVINWRFTDSHEMLVSTLEHGALTWIAGKTDPNAATTVTTTRSALEPVILGQQSLADAMNSGEIEAGGDARAVATLWDLLVSFKTGFPLVVPS